MTIVLSLSIRAASLMKKMKLDKLITHQAIQAIEEADKVLFLVDGRDGITARLDKLAKNLRT